MSADPRLLLYGVFRALVEQRVPLGVADYLDAIRAVSLQVASGDFSRAPSRSQLLRVCEILWTRSPEEVRLLHRVFDRIEPPGADDVAALQTVLEGPAATEASVSPDSPTRPTTALGDLTVTATGTVTTAGTVSVSFESRSSTAGIPLPAPVLPARGNGTFVLQPQTVLSARALAVLWRRYRRMVRSGPRTELDLDATIAERVRRGIIDRPVLRPGRVNRARLLILADASPSMAPWRPFLEALAQSLHLSRVQGAQLWYFANVPRRSLFATPALTNGRAAKELFDRYAGAGLLIVSDGGAARGFLNRTRVTQTMSFLGGINRRMRSIVWVNPMPAGRWEGTSAGALAAAGGAAYLPLDFTAMLRAVDVLRGIKAG
jgi:uncharacterized protein with von Willebrand factor type A (vWA) domain